MLCKLLNRFLTAIFLSCRIFFPCLLLRAVKSLAKKVITVLFVYACVHANATQLLL